ncbi:unnamed protein product, partial [Mesorhabditis belari]|uniref:Chitin synthase chs-1/2 N-terminal putative transporter domain-containing protein n=1 Tax=Mesorhabditis belari TaxID=2138241 RepID=A0AAF3EVJ2_9BILA
MVDGNAAQWDAFRSQKRSAVYTPPFAPWMITALQLAKFSIFVALHSIMLFGAAISKGIIIFLATNLSKPSHSPLETKFSKECPRAVNRDDNLHAGVHISLLLVHIVPDVVSIVQCFYRLTTIGRGQGGINIPVIFLETCRTMGFLLMFFHVFPQLDMLRALLITSCLPIIPIAQKLLMDVSRTMKDEHSLMKRFGMTLATFPSFIVFLVLTAGCYLWTVLDTQFDRYIILPLAIMLASLGFWESWVGVGHAGTFFHHLHQMKYGIRKMNAPTRLLTSTIRIFITLTVFVVTAANGKVTMKGMTGVLFHWRSTEKHWPLLIVALCLCVLHIILRISSRLLAGLELRVLSGFHPIFLTSPLLLTALVIHCHISPDCWIASKVAAVGLTFRCSQWIAAPIPFNDIYLALMWLLISMYKGYQFASQPNFDKHDEIIRATPVVMNPFASNKVFWCLSLQSVVMNRSY